jgi:hypothetical protein
MLPFSQWIKRHIYRAFELNQLSLVNQVLADIRKFTLFYSFKLFFVANINKFSEKGVSIVVPHTSVRVVLFGSFLDDISLIGFTANENCSQTLVNVQQEDFTIQTERRIVIIYEFEEWVYNTNAVPFG